MANRKALETFACAHLIKEHRLSQQEDGSFFCWFCLKFVGDVSEVRQHVAVRRHRVWKAILTNVPFDRVEARLPEDPVPVYVEVDGQFVEAEKCRLCLECYDESRVVRTVLHGEHTACRTCAVDLFAHAVDDNRNRQSCPLCDEWISVQQNVPQLAEAIRNAKAALRLRRVREFDEDETRPDIMESILKQAIEVALTGNDRQRDIFFQEFGMELLAIRQNHGHQIDLDALSEPYGASLDDLKGQLEARLAVEWNALALPEQLGAAESLIMRDVQNRLDEHRSRFRWEQIQRRIAEGRMECERPDNCRQPAQRGAYYRAPCGHYFCFSCGQWLRFRRSGNCMISGHCSAVYGFAGLTVISPSQNNNGGVPDNLPANFKGDLRQARNYRRW